LDRIWEAININISIGLLHWDVEEGRLIPRKVEKKSKPGMALREFYKKSGVKAEILGSWFSEHSLATISTYLKVVL